MKRLIFSVLLLSGLEAQAQPVSWPAEIRASAESLQRVVAQGWAIPPHEAPRLDALGEEFDVGMDMLADLADMNDVDRARANESTDSISKLILLADFRRHDPSGLVAVYRFLNPPRDDGPTSRAALRLPPIHPEIANESNRLAWEYALLRPASRRTTHVNKRIREALALISDRNSVATIVAAIEGTLTAVAIPGTRRDGFQEQMVIALTWLPSQRSLTALLDFPDWIDDAPAFEWEGGDVTTIRPPDPDLRSAPIRALEWGIPPGLQQEWRRVMTSIVTPLSGPKAQRLQEYQQAVTP